MLRHSHVSFFFFFNDTATTEIYTLSLHDALPISLQRLVSNSLVYSTLRHRVKKVGQAVVCQLAGRRQSGPPGSREGSNQSSAQSVRRTSAMTKNAGTDAAAINNTGAG